MSNKVMIPDTVYIAGPITDPKTKQPRRDWENTFNGVAEHLQQQGLRTINPVIIAQRLAEEYARMNGDPTRYIEPPTRDDYLIYDLRCMKKAHDDGFLAGILMLEGWTESDGAQCEYHFARSMGVPVFSQADHGYQLNEYRVACHGDDSMAGLLKWYTLAELAAAVRGDKSPRIQTLREHITIST